MNKYYIGEFEETVLLTVAILDREAYGVAIIEEMEKSQPGISVNI
ncbi:MAG: hypothetical protein SFU99_24425 [Saprospiraceae bacterium]|nr:hypothetical protein [Saprospiraceae bacterium]